MKFPLQDLTFGLRLLRKDKAYTFATVLTLALCIGANTALFSIVNSVLLNPVRVPDPDTLVAIHNSYPKAGAERASNSGPDYYDRLKMSSLEAVAFYNMPAITLGEDGRPEQVPAMRTTPSLFPMLRAKPQLGRVFTPEEGEPGQEQKAILSDGFWRERFGGDRAIVGRNIRLDGRPFTVVGVMPPGFRFLNPEVRMWIPLAFAPEQRAEDARHSNNWQCVARLRPGATLQQAQAQLDAIAAANIERNPAFKPLLVNAGYHTRVVTLKDDLTQNLRGTLYLLWGGTLFVLLIGCVNVVNLALVRSRARLREMATRFALGAGRWRVARQLLGESVLLALLSAAAGAAIGWGFLRVLGTLDIEQLSRAGEISLDTTALAFTLGLAVVLGLVIGAFPLGAVLASDLSGILHDAGRTGTGGRGARALRRALVVTQVGVAFVLLLGAGLLLASFREVLAIDPGFDPRNVLTASVTLPRARYPEDVQIRRFTAEASRRMRALPGVVQAGATSFIPLGGNHSDSVILAEGYQMQPGESVISPIQSSVTPGYFEAMRIPLKRGRTFDGRDADGTLRTIIVDERLARKFWGNADPIGRRMYRPSNPKDLLATDEKTQWLTVIGVVGEVKLDGLITPQTPVGAYYFPMEQQPRRLMTFAVKTAGNPEALLKSIRTEVAGIDPELPLFSVMTMEERAEASLLNRRWPVMLAASFAAVALLLAAIGIYGVLAYLVAQRTKEIGIRMALGGTPRAIFDMVAREGLGLVGVGLAAGAAGVLFLRKAIEAQLYNVRLSDPGVAALAMIVLAAVALVACVIPARRATRIDPVLALNRE